MLHKRSRAVFLIKNSCHHTSSPCSVVVGYRLVISARWRQNCCAIVGRMETVPASFSRFGLQTRMDTPRKGQGRPRIRGDELCPDSGSCESSPENSIAEQDIESRLRLVSGYRGMPRKSEENFIGFSEDDSGDIAIGFSEDDSGDIGTTFSFSWEIEEETDSLVTEDSDAPNTAISSKGARDQVKSTRPESISQEDRQQLCRISGKELREASNRPLHRMIQNGENAYECKVCSEAFNSRPDLETHERAHTGEKPHGQSGVCNKTLIGKGQVLKPQLKHPRRYRECPVCGKAFRRRRNLTAHERRYNGEEVFQCGVCERAFHGRTNLLAHQRTHPGVKPYQCQECGKAFKNADNLKVHEQTHTGERPFRCDFCDKAFGRKNGLAAHMRAHTGERPFQCGLCEKAFSQRQSLVAHKRTHTGERPYQCDVCGKALGTRHSLIAHRQTHTGEKPHKCELCGKAFSAKATLTDHKRTHTGEKPYQCCVCGKAFRARPHLTSHERTHSGEKPFQCHVCEKTFRSTSNLVSHYRTHPGEKPYKCDVCGETFTQRSHLAQHKLTHTHNFRSPASEVCVKI